MSKYSYKEIAKWFINKANSDEKQKDFNNFKLNQFMYFAKGFYYVFQNENLFDGTFAVLNNEIVCKELAKYLKDTNENLSDCFKDEKDITDLDVKVTLDFVYQKIGVYSNDEIQEIMLQDKMLTDKKLTDEMISDYFRENFLQDNQTNHFNIMRDEIVDIVSFITYKKYDKAFRVLGK